MIDFNIIKRCLKYHSPLHPIVEYNIDDLIAPNRADVLVREEFLQHLDEFGWSNIKYTRYYDLVDQLMSSDKDPTDFSKKFANLYDRIKDQGFNKYYLITVAHTDMTHELILNNKKAYLSNDGVELRDGAHRLAVQKHLGKKKVRCYVLTNGFNPPNYTQQMINKNLFKESDLEVFKSSFNSIGNKT